MEYIEFTGKTTEEAIRRAEEHFNLPMNRLDVEVVSAGSSGFLGILGSKKAVVKARPSAENTEEQMAEVMKELTGGEPGPPGDTRPAAPPAPAAAGQEPSPAPRWNNDDYSRGESDPEVIESAREVTRRLVSPLDGQCRVTAEGGHQGIRIEIEGGEAGIIIGRRGQTLDALQYLVTRIVSHQQGRPVRISIDAGGYRRRRRESLESLARRMAEKALMTGRPVAVGPFSSPERRVVHLALKGMRGVSTSSRGRGELKKVLISPRG